MDKAQHAKAIAIAQSLPYAGSYDVRVNAAGDWISPASTAMTEDMKDSLVFVWSATDDGDYGYRLRRERILEES